MGLPSNLKQRMKNLLLAAFRKKHPTKNVFNAGMIDWESYQFNIITDINIDILSFIGAS